MPYQDLTLEVAEGVATLSINRPDRMNALSFKLMMEELPDAIYMLDRDDSVKVLIITGTGDRAFCTGADASTLEDMQKTKVAALRAEAKHFEKIQPVGWFGLFLYRFHKPAIAAINGLTAGAGISLACLCDIRIASETARFNTAFIRRGLIGDVGCTFLLPRLVGVAKALELLWLGDTIDAREAERIGLVNKVVPLQDLMSVAREFGLRLARGPSIAIDWIKQAVWRGLTSDYEAQLYLESRAQQLCISSEDFAEGVESFLEKRKPRFQGK